MNTNHILKIFYIIFGNILAYYCDKENFNNMLCKDNALQYVLPYGIGSSDGIVLQFNNLVNQNCTIIFNSNEGLQILVLESTVDRAYPTNYIDVFTKDEYFKDVCSTDCLYVHVLKTIQSQINLRMNYSKDLKITVTAGKSIENSNSCDENHEIQCKINNSNVCISKELQCDSNINCGTYNLNDEDYSICNTEIKENNKTLILSAGFILTIIIIIILIYNIKKCSPRIPTVFFIAHDKSTNTLATLSTVNEQKSQSLESMQNVDIRTVPIRQVDGNLSLTYMPKRKQRTKRTKMKRMRNNSPALKDMTTGSYIGENGNKPEPTEILNIKLKHRLQASPKSISPARQVEGFNTERQMKWNTDEDDAI